MPILRLNMDETPVPLHHGTLRGTFFPTKLPKGGLTKGQATKAEMRSYLSYVCLVCDDVTVQPLLPQFVLCRAGLLPAEKLET